MWKVRRTREAWRAAVRYGGYRLSGDDGGPRPRYGLHQRLTKPRCSNIHDLTGTMKCRRAGYPTRDATSKSSEVYGQTNIEAVKAVHTYSYRRIAVGISRPRYSVNCA